VPFPLERLADVDSIPALYLGLVAVPFLLVWRGRRLAWTVAVLAAVACLAQALRAQSTVGLLDLEIYTGAARAWAEGRSIYDYRHPTYGLGSTYPPSAAIAFAPLTLVDPVLRAVLWTAVNVAALGLTCRLVATRLLGLRGERADTWALVATGLAAVTLPVWVSIAYQGQVNVLLWLLVVADVGTVGRRSRWTGVGIGVATALKLVPGLFVIYLLTAGQRRGGLRALAVAAGVTLVGALLAPGDSWDYWTDLVWDSSRVGRLDDWANNSLLGTLARLVKPGPTRTVVWVALALAVVVVAMWRARRATRAGDLLAATVVVGCASSLVSPISWSHHLGFLVLALAAVAGSSRQAPRWGLLVAGWVFLLDPLGFGSDATTSGARTVAMLAVVVALPIEAGRSRPVEPDAGAVAPGELHAEGGRARAEEPAAPPPRRPPRPSTPRADANGAAGGLALGDV
jgi:alpha-1,2-mannosyltransferase